MKKAHVGTPIKGLEATLELVTPQSFAEMSQIETPLIMEGMETLGTRNEVNQ